MGYLHAFRMLVYILYAFREHSLSLFFQNDTLKNVKDKEPRFVPGAF